MTKPISYKRRKQPLVPKGGNDRVMTPLPLAKAIILHYDLRGRVLDPCRGEGAFFNQLAVGPNPVITDWCELDEGRDFLTHQWEPVERKATPFDWVVTNPPWSLIRPFLQRSMEVSDNVVFLCLINAFWMTARLRDMEEAGFAIKEICRVAQPHKGGWPSTGFALGAVHVQRSYVGPITVSRLVVPEPEIVT